MTRTLRYKHERSCIRKYRYASEDAAEAARQWDEAQTGVVLYVYQCPWCWGWHHTRQEQKRK